MTVGEIKSKKQKSMKSILLTLLLSALGLAAQDRYVTVTLPLELDPAQVPKSVTNTLEIASGETAHLMCLMRSVSTASAPFVWVLKDAVVGRVNPQSNPPGYFVPADSLVVNGPAKLLVAGYGGGMATFKITPDQYPPDKTVVVPGGPGGATVTLESSTNLVHWTPAASGAYTNLPGVKFFRIKMDRIQP